MSLNLINTVATKMALFLAGAGAILAGETETLYVLNPVDREILAFTALGMIAEHQDDMVSDADIVCAAWTFAISPDEIEPMAHDLYLALRNSQ